MVVGLPITTADGRHAPDELTQATLDLLRNPNDAINLSRFTGSEFADLVSLCVHHRLLSELAASVERSVEPLGLEHRTPLERTLTTWQANSLLVERLAVRVADIFEHRDMPHRILKGVALANLVGEYPGQRMFADLDLVVPANRHTDAVEMLRSEFGAAVPIPEPRAGFAVAFGKAVTLRVGRIEVDLHRTLLPGPFGGRIDTDDLFTSSCTFTVGSQNLSALGPAHLLLHAMYNAAAGDFPPRLGSIRDLVLVAERFDTSLPEAVAAATRWRGRALVQRAAELAVQTMHLPEDHVLAPLVHIDVPRSELLYLRSYMSPNRGHQRELAGLIATPGVAARVRYARALIFPSSEYLRSRGLTEGRHLRRGFMRLTARGRSPFGSDG